MIRRAATPMFGFVVMVVLLVLLNGTKLSSLGTRKTLGSGPAAIIAQAADPGVLLSPHQESKTQDLDQKTAPESYRPGAGTLILGELDKPLHVKKLKVGDAVECRLLQSLLFKGKVVIPRKARVKGRIVEVVTATKDQPKSRVGLVFDKVVLPNKKEILFEHPALVIAIAAPIRNETVHTTVPTDMPVWMSKGQGTGQSVLGAIEANPMLAGANMSSTSGVIGAANRGVIGLPGVVLENAEQGYSVISAKGNLALDFDVQILLQVTGVPAKLP
jgi:hypothetical protein